MMKRVIFSLGLVALLSPVIAEDSLLLESIPVREDMKLIATALSGDGEKAAVATDRGEVWLLNQPGPTSGKFSDYQWKKFASGLRDPSALRFVDAGRLVVRQSVETTLVIDSNEDGIADEYLAVSSDEIPESRVKSPFEGFVWLEKPEEEGPFAGQFFGGSQTGNFLSRLAVETSEEGTHSTLFVFQKGLTYPVEAMTRLDDKTWIIAESNRSDPERTRTKFAIQKAIKQDVAPFEAVSIKRIDTAVEISFTKALLQDTAEATWSYLVNSMEEEGGGQKVVAATLSGDQKKVTLTCEPGLKPGQVYHISYGGLWSVDRDPVRNSVAMFIYQAK